jgi:hypothetical protein
MYAQLISSTAAPERVDELAFVIRGELGTALRCEHGFSGALALADRATGRCLLVLLWETDEEAARPLVSCGTPLVEAMASVARLSRADLRAPTVWEVDARA